MKLRNGEKIIDRLEFIEDTKGNSGDKGVLVITNLRAIWHSMTFARISLCETLFIQCVYYVGIYFTLVNIYMLYYIFLRYSDWLQLYTGHFYKNRELCEQQYNNMM